MAIKYIIIFQSRGPLEFTQIWNFWFENKPSGNPGTQVCMQPAHYIINRLRAHNRIQTVLLSNQTYP
jgi:hypothetical protein